MIGALATKRSPETQVLCNKAVQWTRVMWNFYVVSHRGWRWPQVNALGTIVRDSSNLWFWSVGVCGYDEMLKERSGATATLEEAKAIVARRWRDGHEQVLERLGIDAVYQADRAYCGHAHRQAVHGEQ